MKITKEVMVVKNQRKETWTNLTGQWLEAKTTNQKLICNDLKHLAKTSNILVDINQLIPQYKELFLQDVQLTEPERLQPKIDEDLPMYQPNHLVRYLKDNNIKLTSLEIDTLECILSQGSYYEECWGNTDETWNGNSFIGWYIDEKEMPGCRGALASLKKKGIITIGSDDVNGKDMPCYWTNYMLDFVKDGYYHQLDIPQEFRK